MLGSQGSMPCEQAGLSLGRHESGISLVIPHASHFLFWPPVSHL